MTYYDQHLHTNFSFDSDADLEQYLTQTTRPVVTTEHLEFHNPDAQFQDSQPDYAAYLAKMARMKQRYPNQLLRGIEVGFYQPALPQIKAYLAANQYDLTLLSFHHDGQHDYQHASFRTLDPKQHVQTYYQRMLDGLAQFHDADVLAHFDYGLRVLDVNPEQLTDWAKPQLMQLFAHMVEWQLAFELNTKSMYRWHNQALYATVIPWYLEAGGELFTIGSDAHEASKYAAHFDDAVAMLHELGVDHIVTYQNHRPSAVSI
ncbi:PHP domain-containing protein [Lacticaseibacillus saniviri]|uniref:Histidinol-phosphatase n=1 Tax=Lacticaseibacillus saniviri JCM 17471 = DSM 24301 TaxID=1293598 RepID=A0A0R2N1E1_9LACO|nr:PHP domain-containing protein [Lacticaseibacillus saniviri]KRO18908.1 hypothetical protein IV56_GL000060 [Lacticaseibacillus saniviri JCM 17471 = DSM 24301]MCG4280926.1 PHP domain-containing protein [Lacticaseibacillus saniviri]